LKGAQPGAGIGGVVLEGPGSDAPEHSHPLYSTFEGAHRAGGWLWIVA
jgi:hypothetical protein